MPILIPCFLKHCLGPAQARILGGISLNRRGKKIFIRKYLVIF